MLAFGQGTSVNYVFSVLKDDCGDSRRGEVEGVRMEKWQVQGK